MTQAPFHVRYTLSRGQRLTPHLRIYGVVSTLFNVTVFVFFCAQSVASTWTFSAEGMAVFGALAIFVFVLHRRLVVGLLDVLIVPMRRMDVVVEADAAGILIGAERWYLFLDGITDLRKFRDD